MDYDTLDIGPTPAGESCEQLGPNYRPERAKAECRIFVGQLKRQHGEPPDGASYRVVGNDHDYGRYYEVGIRYDTGNRAAAEYAYKVEGDTPEFWDETAKSQIAALDTPMPVFGAMTLGAVLAHRNRSY